MVKPRVSAGGGLPSIAYVLKKGREAGGLVRLYRRLRSKNACKTCAFGMGGAKGGMVTETGRFPEVCKKSVQAQAGDMSPPIPESVFAARSIATLEALTSRELEKLGRLAFSILADEDDTHFRRVGWDEAIDRVGLALRDAPPAEVFF
jgi:anaerobic selenocysteine-containing dehydrogenase